MVSLRIWTVIAAAAVAAMGLQCAAQSADGAAAAHGITVHPLHPRPAGTVFPIVDKTPARAALEFRSPEQMTAADRELAEANQAEIARRAGLQGLNLERDSAAGGWGYEQAVCPVFPGHLILEYSRDDGHGDVSLFSAVIPRSEGHVRVIPVRRRSYSLWTPASSNAITLNDFNHMVAEGGNSVGPDWLTLGLCYAALAGGHVRAQLVPKTREEQVFPLYTPARLVEGSQGGADVYFTDVTPGVRPMQWKLTFTPKGRLEKVHHDRVAGLVEKPVPGTAVGPETLSAAAAAKAK